MYLSTYENNSDSTVLTVYIRDFKSEVENSDENNKGNITVCIIYIRRSVSTVKYSDLAPRIEISSALTRACRLFHSVENYKGQIGKYVSLVATTALLQGSPTLFISSWAEFRRQCFSL